jgi:hypothetical protein
LLLNALRLSGFDVGDGIGLGERVLVIGRFVTTLQQFQNPPILDISCGRDRRKWVKMRDALSFASSVSKKKKKTKKKTHHPLQASYQNCERLPTNCR